MKLPILAALAAFAFGVSFLPAQAAQPVPVIVELFTSEGCSSCPPADALLSRYAKSSPVGGVEVIALGEHVDYWNHGGWTDPFSSTSYTSRQYGYASTFHLNSVYTPQMIVDGKAQFVGSDGAAVRAAIARAAQLPKASVSVSETVPGRFLVSVRHLPASAASDPAEVFLAATEDNLASSVGGGENSGRPSTSRTNL